MVSIATFSHLVSLIYAAAMTPARWDEAICELHAALTPSAAGTGTVRSTALSFRDGASRTVVGHLLPDAERPYGEYYSRIDHVLDNVENGVVGALRTSNELVATRTDTEFYNDWIRPNDIEAGLFVRLTHGSRPASLVVAGSQRRRSFDTDGRRQLITAVIPHLQQAIDTQRHMTALSQRVGHLDDAVDRLPHGVVVVTSDGGVVDANSPARDLLDAGDGLGIREGRLTASSHRAHRAMVHLVERALSPGVRSGGSVRCERPSGRKAYVLHVVPLAAAKVGATSRPLAMIVVVDPARESSSAAVLLRQLYGLTAAETAVACLALHGQGVPAISEQLTLSAATVRTHLRAIFSKTGTHRQAELVRLLSTVIP